MTAMSAAEHNMSVNIIFKRMGIVRKTKEIIEAISHGGAGLKRVLDTVKYLSNNLF